jgi:uncharacterized protein (DUF362 family)
MNLKSKVSLTKGGDRAANIRQALELIKDDIDLKSKKNIFIKVNFVSDQKQLSSTHVEAVKALLGFLRERYDGPITIGEAAIVPAMEVYRRFGYLELIKEFDIRLLDLSEGNWIPVQVYDSSLQPMVLRYSKEIAESDYRISIAPAKTHDVVVTTLSIKNLAMGALYCKFPPGGPPSDCDKLKMHQGYPVHNLNLYLLNKAYPVNLGIIDGFTGMEGAGPLDGSPVPWGVAVASCDAVAADALVSHMMGFPISEIGYLYYCSCMGLGTGDLAHMEILGAHPEDCYHRFTPHPDYEAQKHWRDKKVATLLGLKDIG